MMTLRPIVIDDDGVVLGGNMRLEALKSLGKKKIPDEWVKKASDLTDEEKKRFIISDNSSFGEWDYDLLANEWGDLPLAEWGVDIPEDWLTTPAIEEDEAAVGEMIDRAAELQKKWKVKRGQIWEIGRHRLMCGDSTSKQDAASLMSGKKAEMMFTDPPYGVDYDGGHFHSGDVNIKRERPKLDGDSTAALYGQFLPVALPHVDGPCYMWFAGSKAQDVYNAVSESRCEIHALLIWHKTNATYASMNAQYKQRHEPFLYFKPKGSTLRWIGPSDECTLWEIKRDGVNEWHPTQKPIELAFRAIGNHDASLVVDWFAGSGSTIAASEQRDRTCFAMELEPSYCSVILERLSALGLTPKLTGNETETK